MTKLLLILGLLVGIFLPGESLAQENKSNFVHVSLVDRMQQDEEIFCDDISRLDMVKRIFWGRVIPLIVILCGLIQQVYISSTDHSEHGLLPVWVVLLVIYVITFLQFAVKYFTFRNRIQK